ncbi:MAG: class I SAM-dependent methyltransferase [Flavobacteriales bacterium]|jgi:SAM-dependent methyltransferase|nr:class I SAM-dependent methyltransferase [Flavobacteriales bacterium]MBT5090137.1 class I SAM-dependent methyltransferase [Flavobacteriales bacterium]MBT5751030.1 class I SAM-dependent methyltransferase [Flavobacteriales bacterium]
MSKEHWENIYATKGMQELSWFQKVPTTSLELINQVAKNKQDAIIDIGGGDGFLVDNLLALGYTDITVLDISENAIDRAKKRLGKLAKKVKWIVADITEFVPNQEYFIWHDRAVFHFLIEQQDKDYYRELVNSAVSGYFILAAFSDQGPNKCSGLKICRYAKQDMQNFLSVNFRMISSFKHNHPTPFGTYQNFIFSVFNKINKN